MVPPALTDGSPASAVGGVRSSSDADAPVDSGGLPLQRTPAVAGCPLEDLDGETVDDDQRSETTDMSASFVAGDSCYSASEPDDAAVAADGDSCKPGCWAPRKSRRLMAG